MKYICPVCGYVHNGEHLPERCPMCGVFSEHFEKMDKLYELKQISNDEAFINAMFELSEKDPIEFQFKLNQFKLQQKQSENQSVVQNSVNEPKCPTCNSTNIEKISTTSKVFGGAMFGLFSSNIRNTMHCKNCGYKW